MDDEQAGAQLIEALTRLEEVADAVTPDEALRLLDEATLQVFWRDWPQLSSWAGALWRRLNQDMAAPAQGGQDDVETGGSG